MKSISIVLLFLWASILLAQTDVPRGTILPVRLNTSLNSAHLKPNQPITARVMQNVPLPTGAKIPDGSRVVGHIIAVTRPSDSDAQVTVQFDTLIANGRHTSIITSLRAMAGPLAVEDAQLPDTGPDHGTPEYIWTTNQIGGDVVYRGNGTVTDGLRDVGQPTTRGVLVRISAEPGSKCRGEVDGSDRLQALWLFSGDACGLYGLPHLSIVHAGRTDPLGQIMLASSQGKINVRAGSGLLLRVHAP
jgi:hypothetical protein